MSENGSTSLAAEQHARILESLQRIIQPLKDEVDAIDARLDELENERNELRAAKREATAVLRAADPEQRAKKSAKAQKISDSRQSQNTERIHEAADQIERLLRESARPGNADGYVTVTWIDQQLEGIGRGVIDPAIDLLIDSGVLRRDKKVRGGGLSYVLVK